MKRATIAILFLSLLSSYASALEKYTVRADDSRIDSWSAGATCRVSYYNICTGWVWCWGGFPDKSRFGMVVDQCCPKGSTASILSTSFFLCDEAHVGYGFTGTIAVHAVDANNCPIGAPIAVQNYCPIWTGPTPFSVVSWGGVEVPQTFAIVVTTALWYNPATYGSDRPAAGPTGPQACGVCYPANRATRSFNYGTVSNPLCPGSTFNDSVCDANLFWDIDLVCGTVSVDPASWGQIKGLYR